MCYLMMHLLSFCNISDEWMSKVEWYWRGKTKVLGKTCRSAALSTTNHMWTSPGSSLGLRDEKVVTIYVRHGSARVTTETRLLS